ncbi:hypothetical protein BGZ49_003227 [Haplosporangium sp. Z 27]|nr:hypothetical protein BGZ49_003227 [Haplosporangium sp. Z 27]
MRAFESYKGSEGSGYNGEKNQLEYYMDEVYGGKHTVKIVPQEGEEGVEEGVEEEVEEKVEEEEDGDGEKKKGVKRRGGGKKKGGEKGKGKKRATGNPGSSANPGNSASSGNSLKPGSFEVKKDGEPVSGFHIVYIRGSPGDPSHSGLVKTYPQVSHVSFEEVRAKLFKNIP